MPNTTDMHIPSNRVRDIERYIVSELSGRYPEGELRMFSRMLFEAFLGWDTPAFLLHRDDTVNQSDLLKFHWAVEDLKLYRPIQHIMGYTEFCGLRIAVNQHVLIPRPETEEIVSLVVERHLGRRGLSVLDICTGSGCIALALQHLLPESQVYGLDISVSALAVARQNAEMLHLPTQFLQSDILAPHPSLPAGRFDIVVSNPPYICEKERADMQANVLDYEPEIALFVPDHDPLRFYRAITDHALRLLQPAGMLVFEVNEHLGPETCAMLHSKGFTTQLIQDFRDKNRCIIAQLS